jgi:2-alkenal reductase
MSEDGYVVTNRHVVSDADASFIVVTSEGRELPATVVAKDAFLDIAVLDVGGDGYPVAKLGDSDNLRPGQTVIAIGNTLSEYRNTVTKGVVSGMDRRVVAGEYGSDEVIENAIQTDAAINLGNSGGPLINLLGEVVGVNTAVSFEGQSIGFAIPINDVKKVVDDIRQYGRIVRPWLGVRYVSLDEEFSLEHGIASTVGALVVPGEDAASTPAVVVGSPADLAGIVAQDIILSVNGIAISEDQPLGSLIADCEPGQTVEMRVARGNDILTLNATLGELGD